MLELDAKSVKKICYFQRNEITESLVYQKLAGIEKDPENKAVLKRIAADEARHYELLKQFTHQSPAPIRWKVLYFYTIARIFGVTFGIKLMENGENAAQKKYSEFDNLPVIKQIAQEEDNHEQALIEMLKEEKLSYMGSIVLGLNDALVELTGALAGFTLALHDTTLVALTGSITGIAAALSMASSEYLSTRMEDGDKHALKAALYTGLAYLLTVVVLILPFLLLDNLFLSLGITLLSGVVIIAAFNYYYSVVKGVKFKQRFLEMAFLSLSVAAISFGIGYVLKLFIGVDV
ncbi:MAG: VIT1/CCC1 transporter family protein [Paludibacteraceae bacterium]|nr:VIT1/CCC1 transporter family protein [Paludibacteraceae bacterium]